MFNEFCDAAHAEPANHLRRNLIPDEVSENRRMITMRFDGAGYRTSDFSACGLIAQEFNMFCPWQCDEHVQSGGAARIQEPEWRRMVNAHDIETERADIRQIIRSSFRRTEIVAGGVWFKRSIGNAFDKEFAVVFEEEFCDRADWLRR